MYKEIHLVTTVHPLGILLGYSISISRVLLFVKSILPWWLTSVDQELQAPTSLVWDSRLVPWIHAYDGVIRVLAREPWLHKVCTNGAQA